MFLIHWLKNFGDFYSIWLISLLFKTMKILPLNLLVDYFRVKFMHEFKFNISPHSFINMCKTRGHMFHVRNKEDYGIPFASLNLVDNLPLYTLPATCVFSAFFINNSLIFELATARFRFCKINWNKAFRQYCSCLWQTIVSLLCPWP